MSDARIGHRHGPWPRRRGLVALLLSTVLATCTTDHSPTGPGRGGRGFFAVRPVLAVPVDLAAFNLTIDNLRVIAIRPPSDTAADTTVAFSPDSARLHVALPVTLNASTETFTLVVQLLAGTKVLFDGTSSVSVSVGPPDTSAAATVPLLFVGPGAKVNHIHISPVDSVVNLGGTQLFHATADSSGTPVDSFYVSWSTSDSGVAKINAQGVLKAPGARGVVLVRAVTPNNVRDSTRVTFIPTPAKMTIDSGNNQSGTVGTRLAKPLRVFVTASDQLGVKGVPVKFQALTPGGSVQDSIVATDSAGYAQDSVALGPTAGQAVFLATSPAIQGDTFFATGTPGPVTAAKSVVTVSSATIGSGAVATLTLQAKDAFGNNLTSGGATVAFSASGGTSTGTIGATVDHANGTYTATFTGLLAGTATTIGATVNGTPVGTTLPTIAVTAGAISPLTSVVSTSAGTVSSGASATLTLQAKDSGGNLIPTGGATVVFSRAGGTSTGTISATTDHGNGTYTAIFTGDTAGTATTIRATIGGVLATSTTTITVVPGNTTAAKSVIAVSKDTIASGAKDTLTLQAKDSAGNNLTTGGLTVVFSHAGGTSTGTISATTDNGNGTYTAVFTGDTAGTATTIHATIGGQQVTSTLPTITVIPGAISTAKSVVTSSDSVTTTGGVLTLTLTGKDAAGNALTKGGATVAFTQSGGTSTGTISATTDNANGTYTATFTGVNGGTPTTIGATIGGVAVTSVPLPTIRVIATVHSTDITASETWVAGTHTVTAYIRVRNGATLTIANGATVMFNAGAGLQIGDTALGQTGGLIMDGTQPGTAPGITLTANTASPTPGFWKGIEVQRNLALATWRRTLIEWAGGTRTPFGALASEACVLFVNRSGAEVDLDSVRIRQCNHAGVHHFGGAAHIHRSEIDTVTGSAIHADLDAQLELDSTVLRGAANDGLEIPSPRVRLLPSSGNDVFGTGVVAMAIQGAQLPGMLRQDTLGGNAANIIDVTAGAPLDSSFTLFRQPRGLVFGNDFDYRITGLLQVSGANGPVVTLDSNVVVRFLAQSGLVIGDSSGTGTGSILSLGAGRGNSPILTSIDVPGAPGEWYGLEIGRLSANTRLANIHVEFAGDSIPGRSKHRFGILVHSPAPHTLALDSVVVVQSGLAGADTNSAGIGILGSGAGVDVRRSVAQGNAGYGFAFAGVANVKAVADTARSNTVGFALFTDAGVSAVAPGDSVAGNVATGNTLYPLSLDIRRLPVLFPNSFTGNGRDTLLVDGHRVTFTDTLPHFAGLPWRVTHGPIQIDSGGSLTLAAGDTLAFDPQLGIVVGASGTGVLAAPGTAGAPILLTASFVPTGLNAFGWGGIEWRQPAASGNAFTFVTVDKGGYVLQSCIDCSATPFGALQFADTGAGAATSVNLTLDHVIVRGSLGPAVQVRRIGTGTISFTNSQFYANNLYDPMISAFLAQPNQLSITGSDLYHYRRWAVSVSAPAGDSVAATNNWWGDVLGPDVGFAGVDSLGRTALDGNAVSFTPFRTTPAFAVGPLAAVVTTQDSAFSTALSTADSIRVRTVDAFGRGVAAVPISWSAPSGTSIAPASGSGDAGGRFDALWQFTTSAGTKVATASASGATPGHYVASITPGATTAVSWTLVTALSQGSVTLPRQITFTSTNRRGVIVTFAHDSFGNATQPFSLCSAAPGQTCPFAFPPEGQVDSTHTSGGTNGDTIFFHANATTPSPFVLRGTYAGPNASQLNDSVIVTMVPIPGGVKIDRDPNVQGVQAVPDTVLMTSICPTGPGNAACQASYTALVVDSALTPIGQGNANFVWHLVAGSAVTFDSTNAFPHDVGYVTARSNGVVVLAVKDTSGNNFGSDTLPIRVVQLPSVVLVTPDTVSVAVGGTTTFHGTVVDAAGDTMTTPVHWRDDNTVNRHLTITDTSVANQVTVRLDSTPFGAETITAYAIGGPGDTAYGAGQVLNPVMLQLPVSAQPWAIAANSQTHAVYVGHQNGQLYLVNGSTDQVADSVAAGLSVSAVAVNAVTGEVYVGTDQGVRVLNGTTLATIRNIATGTNSQGVTNLQGLTVDSAGGRVFVVASFPLPAPVLRQISTATDTLVAGTDVALPAVGGDAVYNPVNGLVYVTIPDSNEVVVIDPNSHAITGRIAVGTTPTQIAVNPVTNRVYVLDQGSDDIAVIDAAAGSVITNINTFYSVSSLAVDAVTNHVYVGVSNLPLAVLIDGSTNTFFTTLNVGNPSFGDAIFGVAFDAGNKKVWTANYSTNTTVRLKY